MSPKRDLLRQLPKIDALLASPELSATSVPRWALLEASRRVVAKVREEILAGRRDSGSVAAHEILAQAEELCRPSLRPVVNATGVVLHTNLGRAPLSQAAVDAVGEVALGYSNLEYNVDTGTRGSRHGHVVAAIKDLCGAEDAVVVNNNAAAVMLALAALAGGKEVVVSRGELIEIGGSFRIPDVMSMSGARLVEVGTTNKTKIDDYRAAVTADTALLMKVHQANFAMVGFVAEVSCADLAGLGRELGIATVMDLGSGALIDDETMDAIGLRGEPTARATLVTGIDLITFSGDKLLGGPQAGIIAGRAHLVAKVRSHPLMRALRPDKITLAALGATLAQYREGDLDEIPIMAMLRVSATDLKTRAHQLLEELGVIAAPWSVEICPVDSTVGGGAKPTAALASWGLRVVSDVLSPNQIDGLLRAAPTPVVARIVDDALIIDVRTLQEDDASVVGATLRRMFAG